MPFSVVIDTTPTSVGVNVIVTSSQVFATAVMAVSLPITLLVALKIFGAF